MGRKTADKTDANPTKVKPTAGKKAPRSITPRPSDTIPAPDKVKKAKKEVIVSKSRLAESVKKLAAKLEIPITAEAEGAIEEVVCTFLQGVLVDMNKYSSGRKTVQKDDARFAITAAVVRQGLPLSVAVDLINVAEECAAKLKDQEQEI
jgi:histone H3/H4